MRDQVLMELVDHAMRDADFRRQAQEDPEAALKAHGYELEPDELEAVKSFQREVHGMSDEELNQALANPGRRQQGG